MSIKFYLKRPKHKGQLRKEEVAIIGRFSLGRAFRFDFETSETIIPAFWNFTQQKAKSTFRRHLELNDSLEDFKREIRELYKKHTSTLPEFKKLCQSRFKGTAVPQEKKTLFIAFEKFLAAYKAEKDRKTVAKYETLLVRLTDFDKLFPADLPNLDFNFYDHFKKFLYKIPNPFYPKHRLQRDNDGAWNLVGGDQGDAVGIFDETVFAYLIQLKTFLGWAEKRGDQVHQSYKIWPIIRRVHPPISLTSSELERLERQIYTSKALEIARDCIVFGCRTGQRISDIKRFDLKDFYNDKWTFTPKKGNRLSQKKITVHFKGYCAPALDILIKYNWKIPIISEQKLNENIKRACKEAGIDSHVEIFRYAGEKRIRISGPKYEFISSHTERKSFITLALQAGLPVEYVMELTGITEYKTIQHYKAKFEDAAIEQELEKIPLMRKAL